MRFDRDSRWLKLAVLLATVLLTMAACGEDEEPTAPGGGGTETEAEGGGEAEFTLVEEGHLTVG